MYAYYFWAAVRRSFSLCCLLRSRADGPDDHSLGYSQFESRNRGEEDKKTVRRPTPCEPGYYRKYITTMQMTQVRAQTRLAVVRSLRFVEGAIQPLFVAAVVHADVDPSHL